MSHTWASNPIFEDKLDEISVTQDVLLISAVITIINIMLLS